MRLEELQVHVTSHALQQFRDRVGPISREELTVVCQDYLERGEFDRQDEYILMGGIWWVFDTAEPTLSLITCYGRLHVDLPAAVKWARMHNDRINLKPGGVVWYEQN